MSQEHYKWDKYSDQPYSIQDRNYKKKIRRRAIPAFLKMLVVNLLLMPFVSLKYFFSSAYALPVSTKNMIGLCINEDKMPKLTLDQVKDLGVTSLSVRIPLADVANLQKYYDFIAQFTAYDLMIVILQDRKHIEDSVLCEESFLEIFKMFKPLCKKFQIGNAINRTKWGFDSVDEYLAFYKIAFELNQNQALGLSLFGSSVIDFEIYAIVRSLFNFYTLSYDGLASLLYVDRRGAPENQQINFDLVKKILLIKCIAALSPKVGKRLVISETNWVIEHTEPYAPALDDVWVSEDAQASYLCRYYLLAMSTGGVETIYWHQLFSPGYGLIDNRDGNITLRKSYFYFKTLIRFFAEVSIQSIEVKGDFYCVNARNKNAKQVSALWMRKGLVTRDLPAGYRAYDALGVALSGPKIEVNESVVYLCHE